MRIRHLLTNAEKKARIIYHDWRHINYLSQLVKQQQATSSLGEFKVKYLNKPGIAFSFDDSFRVDGWYDTLRELFGYYDIKATFNVNAFHHFEGQREHTQEEIDKLIELQAHGHEIAHHTFKHNNSVDYTNLHGVQAWITDEIEPLFNWLENQQHSVTEEKFKRPVTFAFPYYRKDERTIEGISPKYFKAVRGGGHNELVIPFNKTGYIPSLGIDQINLSHPRFLKNLLKEIKQTEKNLVFTCHSVLPKHIDWDSFDYGEEALDAGKYRITPETLEFVIKEAKKNDLEFYTTAEIVGVATFIDRNFEKHIRKLLTISNDRWILIKDLLKIKELDLSNQDITNLDGIQYFLNLETLVINLNYIKDLRLLNKLQNLKHVIDSSSTPNKGLDASVTSGL
ncbi:polysaccharide deacetylase family protein [Pullulanibacillus sp. KACC 23026]|uniref:polysaccharide deacetylase family protein n=1 Tax=Pullulanibacillus sp. KACC 23026 TaxID=3028315 RepID=UPI0023B0E590|nr:polysaccharide deacetylase family protein [Pullulanibacillus sp. KACC 23026]WEG11502.1 polysaccharide deacetylase family protein [Pullulanibacillus sp. KACC 23026]